jgi:hypothetical protein
MFINFDRSGIRGKIPEFYFRNEPPTLNLVLTAVSTNPDLLNLKRLTLHIILKEEEFAYESRRKKLVFVDRNDMYCYNEYLKTNSMEQRPS